MASTTKGLQGSQDAAPAAKTAISGTSSGVVATAVAQRAQDGGLGRAPGCLVPGQASWEQQDYGFFLKREAAGCSSLALVPGHSRPSPRISAVVGTRLHTLCLRKLAAGVDSSSYERDEAIISPVYGKGASPVFPLTLTRDNIAAQIKLRRLTDQLLYSS